ncbi:MAG TPA: DUF4230 domain-containing protein [Xenococcaceae cyanobacterium]
MSAHSQKFWKYLLYLSFSSSLSIFLLIAVSIWHTGDRFLATFISFFQPQPSNLEIDRATVVLQQIQGIQELATTVYTTETVVPTSAERTFGKDWVIATTKLLYLGRGEVTAGIDLEKLQPQDITLSNNKITVSLPPSEILDSKIDVSNSRIYHYDRGFLNLGPDVAPQLQTLAQQQTLEKIVTTACNEGILQQANVKAKTTIKKLLTATSDRPVEVRIDLTVPQSCN